MIIEHTPIVRVNGVRPEDLPRLEHLQQALTTATTPEQRDALLADIQKLKEN